jgi:hypothetical protein
VKQVITLHADGLLIRGARVVKVVELGPKVAAAAATDTQKTQNLQTGDAVLFSTQNS